MKKRRLLRNKKTGEIGELLGTERAAGLIVIDVDFHDGNPRAFDYTSLEQLNEEWEDYEPDEPTEPEPGYMVVKIQKLENSVKELNVNIEAQRNDRKSRKDRA